MWKPIESAPKDGTLLIPLTLGMFSRIDESDLSLVQRCKWHARTRRDRKGFYAVNTSGVRMHRLLVGAWGKEIVDHIDGDGLNNTRRNIRKGSQSQNCVNRRTTPGPYLRGTRPKKGKWQAYIKLSGKQRSLGYFDTQEEANAAYLCEARKIHGDWMPLPAPPSDDTLGYTETNAAPTPDAVEPME